MVTDADLKFLIENLDEKIGQNEKWESFIEKGNDLVYYSAKCCKPKVIHPMFAAEVEEGDVVLEIGPGTGSLTNVLINAGATVLAIEKDPYMATLVGERFAQTGQLKVLQEDFVKCHIHSHMSSLLRSIESSGASSIHAKVVANKPFNISTDVVKQLLPMGDIFSEVVLLLQEETALRLVESYLRTSEYRPINILVNYYSGTSGKEDAIKSDRGQ